MKLAKQPSLRGRGSGNTKLSTCRDVLLAQRSAASPTGCYRLLEFAATASAAESFRSRCGSVRGAPVCSSQTSSVAAPQVGQGTDNICFGVSSLVFTLI